MRYALQLWLSIVKGRNKRYRETMMLQRISRFVSKNIAYVVIWSIFVALLIAALIKTGDPLEVLFGFIFSF